MDFSIFTKREIMSIGQNLKVLRKKVGFSQEEIAQELGLTRSSYSGYENAIVKFMHAPMTQIDGEYAKNWKRALDDLLK